MALDEPGERRSFTSRDSSSNVLSPTCDKVRHTFYTSRSHNRAAQSQSLLLKGTRYDGNSRLDYRRPTARYLLVLGNLEPGESEQAQALGHGFTFRTKHDRNGKSPPAALVP